MWEQLKELSNVLIEDFQHYLSADATQEQQRRRALVRAFFAFVEGSIFALKQTAIPKAATDPPLAPEELAVVTETVTIVDDRGRVRRRALFIRPATNLRFAFSLVARLHNVPFQLKTSGPGWKAFRDAINVRNRLMHPKSAVDLQIADEEFKATDLGFRWFLAEFHLLLCSCGEAAVKKSLLLRQEAHIKNEKARLLNERTEELKELTRRLNDLTERLKEHARRKKELESAESTSKFLERYRNEEAVRLLNEKAQLANEFARSFEEKTRFEDEWSKRLDDSNIAPFDDESLRPQIAQRETARRAAEDALIEL